MSAVEWYTIVVVHIGAIPAVAFPLYYRRSPWKSSRVGHALMFKGRALAALFLVSIAGFWWPFPGYDYLYAFVVTLVVAGICYQFSVMRRLQREGAEPQTPRTHY